MPIITFVNKLDRESRDPFDLLDEIEQRLALDVTPASWPIGMGRSFLGCYDLLHDRLLLVERSRSKMGAEGESCSAIDDPKLDALMPADAVAKLREDVEMSRTPGPPFDIEASLAGSMKRVNFCPPLNTFGVRELRQGSSASAPRPAPPR